MSECGVERAASSHPPGVSGGCCLVVAETVRLTLVPSAGLCTTVVWASWGEVGDTLPCREGDGSEREEDGGVAGAPGKDAEENRRARLTRACQKAPAATAHRSRGELLERLESSASSLATSSGVDRVTVNLPGGENTDQGGGGGGGGGGGAAAPLD